MSYFANQYIISVDLCEFLWDWMTLGTVRTEILVNKPAFFLKKKSICRFKYTYISCIFLLLNPPIYPLALFQIHCLYFSLIVITWLYEHTYIFLKITCSVWIMLLICISLRLTILYWKTNWCALLWGKLFLCSADG